MSFSSPRALEMAAKEAAKKSDLSTNRALTLFWWDRFLTRVFQGDEPEFVLKGGMSMLARMGTRFTKDIDLSTRESSLKFAQKKLIERASRDLGDFFHFEFLSAEPITINDEHLEGQRLTFSIFVGGVNRNKFTVDLVVGCNPIGMPEAVVPHHRLPIKGLIVSDYFLYPLVDTLADKISACLAIRPHGRESSRTKDLVDIVTIASTTEIHARELIVALKTVFTQQDIIRPQVFSIPQKWKQGGLNSQYRTQARDASLDSSLGAIEEAERLAKSMIDPILSKDVIDGHWNPQTQRWEDCQEQGENV